MAEKKSSGDDVGIAVSWSFNGFKAKLKSRFVSSADKLGSTKLLEQNLQSERVVELHQAGTRSLVKIIETATDALAAEIAQDPKLALRALKALERQATQIENIEGTLPYALEDLRQSMTDENESDAGPDSLNQQFLDRYGMYAGQASDEVVREKWGRVLASEIRRPGSFSLKTLRIIDELDGTTAQLFEKLCENRLGNSIPSILSTLSETQIRDLQEAGLLRLTEVGYYFPFGRGGTDEQGRGSWVCQFGSGYGIYLVEHPSIVLGSIWGDTLLKEREGQVPSVDIFALTDVGQCVASILPNRERQAISALGIAFRTAFPEVELGIFKRDLYGKAHGLEIGEPDILQASPVEGG